jgi:hypothetical protein
MKLERENVPKEAVVKFKSKNEKAENNPFVAPIKTDSKCDSHKTDPNRELDDKEF